MRSRAHYLLFFLFLFNLLFPQKKTDSLEALLPKTSGKEKMRVLSALSDAWIRTDRKKAWQYFDEFEKQYFFLKEPLEMKGIYYHQKGTRLMHEGDFDGALNYFNKAEPVFAEQKNYLMLWNLYNGFGAVYEGNGNKEKTLFYFLKAFKVAEQNLDEASAAGSAINLGVIYAEAGNLKEALKYFVRSKNFHEKGGGWGYGNCLNNIGQVYSLSGNTDSAFYYFTKALGVWESMKDEAGLAMTHFNLGELSMRTRDFLTAEAHLLQSLEISERINEQFGITQNLGVLSSLYFEKGDKKKGLDYLERSISFAKKNNMMGSLKDDYEKLYAYHKKEKDFKNALWAHEEFFFWYDSLNNADKNKNLQELYSKFETQKKEKEIERQKSALASKDLMIVRQRNQEILLGAGLALLLAVCVFIFISLRQNKKKNKIISAQNLEVTAQKKIIEEKQHEMLDSIIYARRIQRALLASENLLAQKLSDYFVLYKPRDIVSGDFYWASDIKTPGNKNYFFLAVCDSTGHGVPGAFMSLLNISFLNQAVNEKNISDPAQIFEYLRKMLIASFIDDGSDGGGQDGMDGTLIRIGASGTNEMELVYVSANNHLWLMRNSKLEEQAFDKIPVGASPWQNNSFTSHTLKLKSGDQVYMLTDGYADQFGGPKAKKYKYKSLKEVIFCNSTEPGAVQKQRLEDNFSNWKGEHKQVDDVLVLGIRI
jgi:serine phosphatase RsbU (regulator of sigma subunit)